MRVRVKDLAGQKFGRLLVVGFDRIDEKQNARWLCECECGKSVVMRGATLTGGRSRSCGCLQREAASAMNTTHGATAGGRKVKEYSVWASMFARCRNQSDPAYKDYGARGIDVCAEWASFEQFIADMGPRPSGDYSIDRIDNDLGYCKANCRWATRAQQARNNRRNRFINTPWGVMVLTDAAALAGIHVGAVRSRLRRGWAESDLLKPVETKRST